MPINGLTADIIIIDDPGFDEAARRAEWVREATEHLKHVSPVVIIASHDLAKDRGPHQQSADEQRDRGDSGSLGENVSDHSAGSLVSFLMATTANVKPKG